MESPSFGYLYTLALLAISYGGFAALFMLLREQLTGKSLRYDAFLIRSVMQKGFIVAACAMLPPLFTFSELPQAVIWRLPSFMAGALQVLYLATWRSRMRELPRSIWLLINFALQFLNGLYLLAGASGLWFDPSRGHFLIGVTLILFLSGIAYQEALVLLLQDRPEGKKRRS